MGIPMVTCSLCNAQVSKRASLLIEPYGRICRSHPEVEQHKEKLAEIARQQAANKKLESALVGLQVMMIVEQIRMMAYMSGHSLELTMFALSHRLPKGIREEVEKKVRERGMITQKEADDAVSMAAYMATKGFFKKDAPASTPADPLDGPVDNETMKGLFPGSTEDEEIGKRCIHRPPSLLIDPKDFENHFGYRYVRFADGKVLFCSGGDINVSHKQVVDAYTAAPPVSAGTIKVKKGKRWAISEGGSQSAKLTRAESDEKYIAKELGPGWTWDSEAVY